LSTCNESQNSTEEFHRNLEKNPGLLNLFAFKMLAAVLNYSHINTSDFSVVDLLQKVVVSIFKQHQQQG